MNPHYIYVMGGASGVGKSTVCLGLLAKLLGSGFCPGQLAYIKPVTQCLSQQTVAVYCQHTGITCQDLGRLVFSPGFSKAFINGQTPNADRLRQEVLASVLDIGKHKTVVIVDGVGDPSVGSVVGVTHTDLALALPGKVIFVGKPGIGAALDNTVLCVSFMQQQGLADIGVLYNNIRPEQLPDIKTCISLRLPALLPQTTLLGFISAAPFLSTLPAHFDNTKLTSWFSAHLNNAPPLLDWLLNT